jgi:alpha-amylase
MEEWALPIEAGRELARAKRDLLALDGGERLAGLLRGGFWRSFLVKYPEVAEIYWKMLRVSAAVTGAGRATPEDRRVLQAREALWRGQANDAYWHGVFGGCYLPHLRRAVKSALLEAEARLPTADPVALRVGDVNGDGRDEILIRTPGLAVTLNPAHGGTVTEIGALVRRHDLADVFGRRPEAYHAKLAAGAAATMRSIHDPPSQKEPGLEQRLVYDRFRRACLLDGWFEAAGELDPVEPWPASRASLGEAVFSHAAERRGDAVDVRLSHRLQTPAPLEVDKRVSVRDAALTARYRLAASGEGLSGRWAVQWNLALSAGDAPGRYLTALGHPSLGSTGRVDDAREITLVDEWLELSVRLSWSPSAELTWGPVETVSVSEGGFERIYQGLALLLVWPLGGERSEMETTLTVTAP